jgi:hypothetical protein
MTTRQDVWAKYRKIRRVSIATILFLGVLLSTQTLSLQAQKKTTWTPATYRGLTVGLSSKEDVLRVLGTPSSISKDSDSSDPLWHYQVSDPFPGSLEAWIKDGTTLGGFTLTPSRPVPKAEIIKIFGSNYRYSKHLLASGPVEMLSYPNRGIAAIFEYENNEAIDLIIYSVKPVNPQ